MNSTKEKHHKMTWLLFVIYLVVLTWIILFKMQFSIEDLVQVTGFRSMNLVPFQGTAVYDGILDFQELSYNVLIFMPFGLYISMLKPEWTFLKKVAPMAAVSLMFELSQYIFRIGSADITDFLGNTLGGILGIGLYFLFRRVFKRRAQTALILLALLGTVAMVILGLLLMFDVIQLENFAM